MFRKNIHEEKEMATFPRSSAGWQLNGWQTIVLFGLLQLGIYTVGTFFFDFFAGSATQGGTFR